VFHIPGFLRSHTAGSAQVRLDTTPATARDALAALFETHPGVRDRVLDEQGHVRQHVNVFVDTESIRHTGGLETALRDGCEISIVPAVSGGRDPR